MKEPIARILISIALVMALVVGVVIQNHHHHADGRVCLEQYMAHSHQGHSHHAPEADDCAMHLDSFCCDGSHHYCKIPVAAEICCIAVFLQIINISETDKYLLRCDGSSTPLPNNPDLAGCSRRGPPLG
ncbi:MAG: hypothetical protein NC405_00845 [Odoribacter sp.]|nr:hypothetical protein [Odoribacter sp.]